MLSAFSKYFAEGFEEVEVEEVDGELRVVNKDTGDQRDQGDEAQSNNNNTEQHEIQHGQSQQLGFQDGQQYYDDQQYCAPSPEYSQDDQQYISNGLGSQMTLQQEHSTSQNYPYSSYEHGKLQAQHEHEHEPYVHEGYGTSQNGDYADYNNYTDSSGQSQQHGYHYPAQYSQEQSDNLSPQQAISQADTQNWQSNSYHQGFDGQGYSSPPHHSQPYQEPFYQQQNTWTKTHGESASQAWDEQQQEGFNYPNDGEEVNDGAASLFGNSTEEDPFTLPPQNDSNSQSSQMISLSEQRQFPSTQQFNSTLSDSSSSSPSSNGLAASAAKIPNPDNSVYLSQSSSKSALSLPDDTSNQDQLQQQQNQQYQEQESFDVLQTQSNEQVSLHNGVQSVNLGFQSHNALSERNDYQYNAPVHNMEDQLPAYSSQDVEEEPSDMIYKSSGLQEQEETAFERHEGADNVPEPTPSASSPNPSKENVSSGSSFSNVFGKRLTQQFRKLREFTRTPQDGSSDDIFSAAPDVKEKETEHSANLQHDSSPDMDVSLEDDKQNTKSDRDAFREVDLDASMESIDLFGKSPSPKAKHIGRLPTTIEDVPLHSTGNILQDEEDVQDDIFSQSPRKSRRPNSFENPREQTSISNMVSDENSPIAGSTNFVDSPQHPDKSNEVNDIHESKKSKSGGGVGGFFSAALGLQAISHEDTEDLLRLDEREQELRDLELSLAEREANVEFSETRVRHLQESFDEEIERLLQEKTAELEHSLRIAQDAKAQTELEMGDCRHELKQIQDQLSSINAKNEHLEAMKQQNNDEIEKLNQEIVRLTDDLKNRTENFEENIRQYNLRDQQSTIRIRELEAAVAMQQQSPSNPDCENYDISEIRDWNKKHQAHLTRIAELEQALQNQSINEQSKEEGQHLVSNLENLERVLQERETKIEILEQELSQYREMQNTQDSSSLFQSESPQNDGTGLSVPHGSKNDPFAISSEQSAQVQELEQKCQDQANFIRELQERLALAPGQTQSDQSSNNLTTSSHEVMPLEHDTSFDTLQRLCKEQEVEILRYRAQAESSETAASDLQIQICGLQTSLNEASEARSAAEATLVALQARLASSDDLVSQYEELQKSHELQSTRIANLEAKCTEYAARIKSLDHGEDQQRAEALRVTMSVFAAEMRDLKTVDEKGNLINSVVDSVNSSSESPTFILLQAGLIASLRNRLASLRAAADSPDPMSPSSLDNGSLNAAEETVVTESDSPECKDESDCVYLVRQYIAQGRTLPLSTLEALCEQTASGRKAMWASSAAQVDEAIAMTTKILEKAFSKSSAQGGESTAQVDAVNKLQESSYSSKGSDSASLEELGDLIVAKVRISATSDETTTLRRDFAKVAKSYLSLLQEKKALALRAESSSSPIVNNPEANEAENSVALSKAEAGEKRTNSNEVSSSSVSSGNLVDKKLAASVVATCIERNCRRDCLEVVSRVLDFDEDERKRVGLVRSGGFWDSFLPDWSRGQARAESINMNDRKFSDLLNDFVNDEIHQ